MKKLFVAFSVLLVLSACAPMPINNVQQDLMNLPDDVRWQKTTQVKDSEFDQVVKILGMSYTEGTVTEGGINSWYLQTLVDKKTHAIKRYLTLKETYTGGWKFIEWADSNQGEKLPLTVIDRQVQMCLSGDCIMQELVSIEISEEILKKAVDGKSDIRITSKRDGSYIIHIYSKYAIDLLNAEQHYLHLDKTTEQKPEQKT
jgi:hypothetical protein